MRAARIHAYGDSEQIVVEQIAQPVPAPDEVLIAIRDAGVNPVDWKIREGYLAKARPRPLPFTLGQDFCGEVLAVGADVTDVVAGDEVYGFANGTYAELAVASPEMFTSKPRTVTDAVAAGLPTPGLTALQLVRDVVEPRRGQTVLIHGAAGAVGSIATQLCIARGARVIATAAARDLPYLASLGVGQVSDYRTERFEDRARGVDAVIDLVGGDTFTRSIAVVGAGGVIATTVGPVAGVDGKQVRGVRFVMRRDRRDLQELARLVDDGVVTPRGTRVMPLEEVRDAQELSQRGHVPDKLVLAMR